jgi:hypothetical protein
VRRSVIATVLTVLVLMASDACDHVTDKEVVTSAPPKIVEDGRCDG